jgi:hypothetical protein
VISRGAEVCAVTAVSVILTIAVAVPVLRAPSQRIFGRETVGRHRDPFTVMAQSRRPLVDILHTAYVQPLTDIPDALLERASGPVAAYNWLVLLTFPLAAAAAFLLARHLALGPAAAAGAALAFAFSPFHVAHAAYHPQIAQIEWIPLYFLLLWRCLDDATVAAAGLLALSIAAVTLSNFYGGLIAAVITPVAVPAYWFCRSRHRAAALRNLAITLGTLLGVAAGAIGAAGAAGGAGGLWHTAHDALVSPGALAFPRADLFLYSAKWWSYLVPPVANPLVGELAGRAWTAAGVRVGLLEQQVALGWGIVALGLVAAVAWLGRGRQEAHPASLAAVPYVAVVAGAALVCSLSPERQIGSFTFVRPSAWLYPIVPMFRAYARFGVVVQLMAALLAGIGAERLWRSGTPRAKLACVALLLLAAAEYAVWPPSMSRDVLPTLADRWVAEQPGVVQALDCAPLTQESASIEWLTGHRISLARESFSDCTQPELARKLAAAGYTHLIVRGDTPAGRWVASRPSPDGLQRAARFADGDVFTVASPRPLVYTSELAGFYPREYDALWTWRWMDRDASWVVVNRSDRTIVAGLDLEGVAFHHARRLTARLDGSDAQTLTVAVQRGTSRIGPLALTPGNHILAFHADEAPTTADAILHNGDHRPVSFAFGVWRWTVEQEAP